MSLDILTDAISIVARLIMDARSDRDAEALVHQLRALGPAQRADVDGIEARARERLAPDFPEAERKRRQDEPTQTGPLPQADAECEDCGYVGDLSVECPDCSPHRIGGPLDEGD
jgi:hypothetical protein